ncbi:MAG: TonB-dependent receptor plug domain-containing protein [Nitrospirae bacterium]|nr:TonB-dependent receptor plug domain-containing protein [Nitrospirota bacterium]
MVHLLISRIIGMLGLALLAVCLAQTDGAAEETPLPTPVSELSSTLSTTLSSSLSSTISSTPTQTVTITGSLLERGTKRPLPSVNVFCFPASYPDAPIKVITDRAGKFSIDVPEGRMKWVISISGYNRLELEDEQQAGTPGKPRLLYLEKKTYLTYETTVYGETEKRDDKTRSLDQAQFATVPGAGGDPIKAVQNLPGVNRPGAFSSQIIIEGSSPNDTRYNLDNQPIPIIFHFGGLSSVVMSEAVDHVDYLSAGFGPEFGQTIAGLVNLTVKDPQTDRTHGFVYADTMNAGGMVEGPINDHSSYLFGMRQSYIGYVLGAVVGNDNKNFNLTAVPEFRDILFEYKNQVSTEDTFKLVTIGSQDTFAFLLKQPVDQDPAIRGNFKLDTKFFRVIPEWTHRFSPDAIGRISLGMGKDWVLFDLGDYYVHNDQTALSGRAEIENQLGSSWKSYLGADFLYNRTTVKYQLPIVYSQGGISSPIGSGDVAVVSKRYESDVAGLYWRNVFHQQDSRWSFIPGVRVSWFNLTDEVLPEPRVGIRYALDHGLTLRAASGLYNQAPAVQTLDKTYGNPDLTSQRAVHYTAGFEKDFREGSASGWSLSNDFFYKHVYDLVARTTAMVSPSRPQYYDNSGYGHIYGLEFMGKYKSSQWQGWIAYTLSRSRRGDALTPETISQYDQTHLLTAVAERELGRNWMVSARVRYTTGNPYTPIIGAAYDVNSDLYVPARGDIYSARMGAFFQADLRFDKKWVYDRRIMTGYLDIQNITNQQNPQEIRYSYDYQQSEKITGLPIYPTLGIKLEF